MGFRVSGALAKLKASGEDPCYRHVEFQLFCAKATPDCCESDRCDMICRHFLSQLPLSPFCCYSVPRNATILCAVRLLLSGVCNLFCLLILMTNVFEN